ncbi:GMC family oxidoreductase [Mesorhizobium neociceri]|uniref:GMC family oxidoreductase N-terminal domain-containing protein n=1 Tax=Mesorhizobium neociceri TaxID=1307853 RepID=A0A838BGP7_9HYPH|nr:GMC family oxidoreductase N-terminal domain-containing protein [Mesorhizobium neociceri]MBA1144680.1 GMC family oxidoreductase N-terminal domain-containing protein [Mesorhizobium neociceri]
MRQRPDYIIVGGGSTGCTLAGRLTEDAGTQVALFEQGPADSNPWIHLPATYYKVCKGPLLSRYPYERSPEQTPAEHPTMIQARVLGGGSSVNAMLYVRGVPDDYDGWAASGADGWAYADVLPYFKRAEGNNRFDGGAHNSQGPLGVSDARYIHPLTRVWLQACQQAGLPYNSDFNSGEQSGVGFYQVTTRDGRRSSAAAAYIRPALNRPNLDLRTNCQVRRILFEGRRAVGVEFIERGKRHRLMAEREIILSAGAIATPHLLLLSGVGPARHLSTHGIRVVADLPGVGQNYQDHMEMSLVYSLSGPYSYDKYKKPWWAAKAGLEYLLFRSGPVTSNVAEAGGFWWSSNGTANPDIQLFFLAGAGVEEGVDTVPGGNGCTISVSQTRPKSRGFIELTSGDESQSPRIVPNYLTHPDDIRCLADGARLVQDIVKQTILSRYVEHGHIPPRPLATTEEFETFVRSEAHPGLHPCGTCRIGRDPMAVVDPQLRVHGVERLRIADASVMPDVISGNLNSVVIMIGEKAADLIRDPAANLPAQFDAFARHRDSMGLV